MKRELQFNLVSIVSFSMMLFLALALVLVSGRLVHWRTSYREVDAKYGIELKANITLANELQRSLEREQSLSQSLKEAKENASLIAALDPLDFLMSPIEISLLVDYIPQGNPFESEWYLTSRYGSDAGYGGNPRQKHQGQDIVSWGSINIHPIAEGRVVDIGIGEYEGKWVLIEHNEYVRTKVMHLEKIFYTSLPGEEVTEETLIGLMGSTGYSDGAHLHIEIHVFNGQNWVVIDPYPYITGERI